MIRNSYHTITFCPHGDFLGEIYKYILLKHMPVKISVLKSSTMLFRIIEFSLYVVEEGLISDWFRILTCKLREKSE